MKILKGLSRSLLVKFFNALLFKIITVKFVGATIIAVIGRNAEQEATEQINLSPTKRVNRISLFFPFSADCQILRFFTWTRVITQRRRSFALLRADRAHAVSTAAKKHYFRPKDVAL